jgi:SNF2 family DNA or RNA helicase
VVTSYALLQRDVDHLAKVGWAQVVLDEAQNVKNANTRQARAARALAADFRVALTGTPVENHVGELWSLMDFLNPGLLGTRADFRRRFLVPIQGRGDREAASRLRRIGPGRDRGVRRAGYRRIGSTVTFDSRQLSSVVPSAMPNCRHRSRPIHVGSVGRP